MSFEEYGLSPELLNGLTDVRIEKPTPLQQEVLPAALQGKHLLVKTEADDEGIFLIPALQKIAENGEANGTQVLILTPSIERATKIDEMIWAMGYHAQIGSALLAMKGNKSEQEQALMDGAPVIVANPGRLIEILEKNNFHLRDLKLMVIDEAHNMENFNLVNRVKDILRFVEGDYQTLILSSKKNKATEQLVKAALKNPELIGFESVNGLDESKNESSSKALDIDLDAVEKKLKEASVKVVLNSEEKKNDDTKESSDVVSEEVEIDLQAAEKKLEEAEVEVVLNPEEQKEGSEKKASHDPGEAEQKLKKASIKVVLKKDIEEKQEEVEPVLANPILQADATADPVPKDLEQGFINVPPRMKISTLMAHLQQSASKKVMVFTASKRTTDRLFHIIRKKSWGVVSVSADLDEETYNERFSRFTTGEMRICLVGGIAADQVEIEAVEEVINYDVPNEVEEYRYRAELVGNGKASRIISLVSKMDREDIDRISEEVGYPPVELELPEEVADKKKKTSSKKRGKSSNKNVKQSNDKGSRSNKRSNQRGNKKRPPRKKKKEMALPRPSYEGLSGGREGKKESGGVFGWVKKLFD